jgi:DNA replication and repair protein RecF
MTAVVRFRGENLRSVSNVELLETSSLNILVGPNGAGKTSVLEGIHILGSGRSFRTRQLRTVVRRGEEFLRVTGSVDLEHGGGLPVHVGVERSGKGLTIRAAGQPVAQTSALARLLPLLVIRPESQDFFTGASEERRRVLDWGVFHVEPEYLALHSRYARSLKQRNAALRQRLGLRDVAIWDMELIHAGLALNEARTRFINATCASLEALLTEVVGLPVTMDFRRGWSAEHEFEEALRLGRPSDIERGTTQRGPHRADIRFVARGVDARQVLSRGEGKRLVLSFLLGMAEQVGEQRGTRPVLLLDDLASELDEESRALFLEKVFATGFQTFITTVDTGLISKAHLDRAQVFHVKQGAVSHVI